KDTKPIIKPPRTTDWKKLTNHFPKLSAISFNESVMLSTPSFSHPGRSTDCSNKEVTTRFASLINEGRLFVKLLACSTMGGPTIEIAIQIKPTNKAKIIVILPHLGIFHFSKSN